MKSRSKRRLLNMMASAAFIGALTGSLTAVVVLLYKFCAVRVIEFSEIGYEQLRLSPVLIPGVLLVLLGIAFLYATIYQKYPNLRGDISAGSGAYALSCDPDHGAEFMEKFQDQLYFGTDRFSSIDEPIPPQKPLMDEWLAAGRISKTVYEKISHLNAEKLLNL